MSESKCPTWCGTPHQASDVGRDRDHVSAWSADVRPDELEVYIRQAHGSTTPRVVVWSDSSNVPELSDDEALELARALTVAADIAEGHANPDGAS